MIVDLNENQYVIDNKTHEHRVRYIDPVNKIVFADDVENADVTATITVEIHSDTINSTETKTLGGFYYGTHPLTVCIKGQ